MKISVIIPVRNCELYLGDAISSAQANADDLEIVVVDDASTDRSGDIARSFPQVTCHRQEQAGGAAARHLGVELSRGELLSFLDADDLWCPGKLQLQVDYLRAHPQAAGVYGKTVQFVSPDLSPQEAAQLQFDPRPTLAQMPGALLLRREAYHKVGTFHSRYQVGDFLDWCLRAQEAGCRFGEISEVVLRRRLHRSNLGRTLKDSRQDYARIVAEAMRRRRAQ